MDFTFSDKVADLAARLESFMEAHVYPAEKEYHDYVEKSANRWTIPPIMEELKKKARAEGLWNLFLAEFEDYGAGLTNLEYAPLAEILAAPRSGPQGSTAIAP